MSHDFEDRIQKHLDRMFGEDKSRVLVTMEVGISKELERDYKATLKAMLAWQKKLLKENLKPKKQAAARKAAESAKKTDVLPEEKEEENPHLVAAYIVKRLAQIEQQKTAAETDVQKVRLQAQRPQVRVLEPEFLSSLGYEIKYLYVEVTLDESIPLQADHQVGDLISNFFEFDESRGDVLQISRAKLYPEFLQQVLNDRALLGSTLKLLVVAAMLVVGILMAAIIMRKRNIVMDFSTFPLKFKGVSVGRGVSGNIDQLHMEQASAPAQKALSAAAPPSQMIEVGVEKVPDLVRLVAGSEPRRIALVVARLKPEVNREFLKHFDEQKLSEIFSCLSEVQFMEPSVMAKLKDEVEKRITGAIGGEKDILKTLAIPDNEMRSRILRSMQAKDPQLFDHIRARIFLFSDFANLPDADLAKVLGIVTLEDVVKALNNGDSTLALKDRISKMLPEDTAKKLTDQVSGKININPEQISESQGKMSIAAEQLIASGSISHPMGKS
ncbi:FliG C-terminal domain-containing protein [Elusimicrobiota bacterium]